MVDSFAVTYENMGKKGQLGLATIRVVIADLKLINSSQKAPTGQKTKSKSFYLLMKEVYKALHGFSGHDHYTVLIRIREGRLKRNDGVRAHEMLFTVEIKDISAAPPKVTVATTEFDVEINTGMRLQNSLAVDGIGEDVVEDDFVVD